MKLEGSFPCSQQPATCPHREPEECRTEFHPLFISNVF